MLLVQPSWHFHKHGMLPVSGLMCGYSCQAQVAQQAAYMGVDQSSGTAHLGLERTASASKGFVDYKPPGG